MKKEEEKKEKKVVEMEIVEFFFKQDGKEQSRKYEVGEYEDAVSEFKLEFPDEATKPTIFRVRVEHLKSNVV